MWSNVAPDEAFTARLAGVFAQAWAEPVTFHNPLQDRPFTQTVYLARTAERGTTYQAASLRRSVAPKPTNGTAISHRLLGKGTAATCTPKSSPNIGP